MAFQLCFRIRDQEPNRIDQLLVYVDSVNTLAENIHNIKKTRAALLQARKEVGLEVNTEKTKYMVMSHHQNAG
jgi:hypothetical protein